MIFKKIKTLALASLCCTIINLMSMEMALPEPESAVIAAEADSVIAAGQIPTQVSITPTAISHQPTEDIYLKAQWAYFWNYAIAHLDHCPPELLRPLAEKAFIQDRHLSALFAPALSRKNKREEHAPSMPTNPLESPQQNTHLQPFSTTIPKEPAVNSVPASLPIPEKDAATASPAPSHKKQKQKEPIWHYESGLKKADIKSHVASVIADPPQDHSKWTAALLYEALKKKGLYFEIQDLETFLNKNEDPQK